MVIPPSPGRRLLVRLIAWSARGHVDGDRHAVSQHVVDGGPVHGLLYELAELGGRRVAAHAEADPDLAEPVADLVGQAENSPQVDVALDSGLDRGQRDFADGGDVAQPRGQAGGQGREQDLRRGRRGVLPKNVLI
jgi:hypothetical protein